MKPITFSCEATFLQQPEQIANQILDLSKWPDFKGYGPLPGIKQAQFEVKTDEIIGTRIRVVNQDGSTHIEEIVEWEPTRHLCLHLKEFSPPLSRLATRFEERWEFQLKGAGTRAVRSFTLHPKSILAKPILRLISIPLKKGIMRHLKEIASQN